MRSLWSSILKNICEEMLYGKLPITLKGQGEAQEVGLQQAALQAREMSEKVIDGFAVQFDRFQVDVVPLQQVLRQDSHSRADFQNVAVC